MYEYKLNSSKPDDRAEARNPKMRDLKTVFIVTGDGKMYIYHRGTGLKKTH